jgi:hypothetical protein
MYLWMPVAGLIYVSNRHFFTNSNTEIHYGYIDGRYPYRDRLNLPAKWGRIRPTPLPAWYPPG